MTSWKRKNMPTTKSSPVQSRNPHPHSTHSPSHTVQSSPYLILAQSAHTSHKNLWRSSILSCVEDMSVSWSCCWRPASSVCCHSPGCCSADVILFPCFVMLSLSGDVVLCCCRPVALFPPHHHPQAGSCWVGHLASCWVGPMTMNNEQPFIVRRLVATSPIATWHLLCVWQGECEGGICFPTRVVMNTRHPLWYAFAGIRWRFVGSGKV
jgi:hypothetical protein